MSVRLIRRHIYGFAAIFPIALFVLASGAHAQQGAGYLNVASQPENAMIYVNSQYTNSRTPTSTLLSFEPGVYRISLTKPGYNIYEDRMTIRPGEILEIHIVLAKGDSEGLSKLASERYVEAYINVKSAPSGADVYLDDKLIGKTPVKDYEIPVGDPKDRNLRLVRAGYKPHEETIDWIAIRDRVKIHVSAELKPVEQIVAKTPGPKAMQKKKRFTMNTQVIVLLAMLAVAVAILAIRIVIRIRQRNGDD